MSATITSNEDINILIASTFKKMLAIKDKEVHARAGVVGEKIITLVDGGQLVETTNTVGKDGDMVVTNVIDGMENSHIVLAEKFAELYVATGNGNFKPISGEKEVFIIDRDVVIMAPWGEPMHLREGAALVREGEGFYGINPLEFAATYRLIDEDAQERTARPASFFA